MNPIFFNIIINNVKRHVRKKSSSEVSSYVLAKESRKDKIITIGLFKDVMFILLGILSAGFGLKGFLLPNGFIDGGVGTCRNRSCHSIIGSNKNYISHFLRYAIYRSINGKKQ